LKKFLEEGFFRHYKANKKINVFYIKVPGELEYSTRTEFYKKRLKMIKKNPIIPFFMRKHLLEMLKLQLGKWNFFFYNKFKK